MNPAKGKQITWMFRPITVKTTVEMGMFRSFHMSNSLVATVLPVQHVKGQEGFQEVVIS